MKRPVPALAVVLIAGSLAACSQPSAPPSPPSPPSAPGAPQDPGSPRSFFGRQAEKAIAAARDELARKNIEVGGLNIQFNGRKINQADPSLPKAEISPQGDLLIQGQPVQIDDGQRRRLLDYRAQVLAIADAGMTLGVQGADLAGEALGGVVSSIFGGEDGRKAFERRMEERGEEIKAEALKLCAHLPGLLEHQQQLAESVPAFRPYARLTREDIEDCGKDAKDHSITIPAI